MTGSRTVIFDTGPLLCFAAIPTGPSLLKRRFRQTGNTTEQVWTELRGLRRNANPAVADAAVTAVQQMGWLQRHAFDAEADFDMIEDLRGQLRTFQKRPPPREHSDTGECSVLLLAQRLPTPVVVFSEDPARKLARARDIPVATVVDILRAMCRDGTLTREQAYTHYRTIVSGGLDPGDVVRGKDDLR